MSKKYLQDLTKTLTLTNFLRKILEFFVANERMGARFAVAYAAPDGEPQKSKTTEQVKNGLPRTGSVDQPTAHRIPYNCTDLPSCVHQSPNFGPFIYRYPACQERVQGRIRRPLAEALEYANGYKPLPVPRLDDDWREQGEYGRS